MAGKPRKKVASSHLDVDLIRGAAGGRWVEVLVHVAGLPIDHLDGHHHPCPKCGGSDRFRLLDVDKGAVLCNQCFNTRNGDGFAAVQWALDTDFRTAAGKIGEYLGIAPIEASHRKKKGYAEDPKVALEREPWTDGSRRLLAAWCDVHKPGTSPEAVLAAGGFLARYPCYVSPKTGKRVIGQHRVIALPIYGPPNWTTGEIVGAQVYRLDGGMLEKKRKDQPPEFLKVKTVGAATGLVGLQQLDGISPASVRRVWKVEGCSDLLALLSLILADASGQPPTDVVLTNAGGSNQNVGELIRPFATLAAPTYVLHDADQPGENGAVKWSSEIAAVTETHHVRLPYPIAPDHGPDLRDWINGSHVYRDLLDLADAAPVVGSVPAAAGNSEEPPVTPTEPAASTTPPADTITNATRHFDAEDQPYVIPIPMSQIVDQIFRATDAWPRRVGPNLFVHEGANIHWLESPPSVFGWLGTKTGVIEWHRKVGCASKEEVYHSLRREAQEYEMVEFLPHEPIWPGHYYAYDFPADSDGTAATALVDRFSPETDEDRCLILALFATIFWGGNGGTRPAFVITSDAGRGSGKSKLTDMVSYLAGGHIELSHNENAEVMRQRLLSPEGMNKRVARLDNVKSLKFSWSDLESMITAPVISGKRMYTGEGTRPNNLTWLITLNGPSMSTDMAQRSVIIKLAPPARAAQWEADTIDFIDANRPQIISDLLTFLRKEPTPITTKTRWASWEGAVLSRVPDPEPVQDAVAFRSAAVDTEGEEVELVEQCFAGHLEKLGYDVDVDKVMIPSPIAADWYNALTRDKKHPVAVGRILSQFICEGRGGRLQTPATKKHGRGVVWVGTTAFANQETLYDVEKRIEQRNESDRERKYRKW